MNVLKFYENGYDDSKLYKLDRVIINNNAKEYYYVCIGDKPTLDDLKNKMTQELQAELIKYLGENILFTETQTQSLLDKAIETSEFSTNVIRFLLLIKKCYCELKAQIDSCNTIEELESISVTDIDLK